MNKLVLTFSLLALLSLLGVEAGVLRRRVKRTVPAKYLAALPLIGGYALYRKLKTGSYAPPQISLGVEGNVGVGPVDIGGKVGFGAGGPSQPGDQAFYEPLSEDEVGAEGFHVGGQTVVGVDNTRYNLGGGLAGGFVPGKAWPSFTIPEFVKKIPGYIKSIPSYLPSWSSLPSLPSLSSDVKLVEYDADDTDGWVTVPQSSSWSNVFGVNGGLGLGPFKVNGGLNLGR